MLHIQEQNIIYSLFMINNYTTCIVRYTLELFVERIIELSLINLFFQAVFFLGILRETL
jgi:hypothetical protein